MSADVEDAVKRPYVCIVCVCVKATRFWGADCHRILSPLSQMNMGTKGLVWAAVPSHCCTLGLPLSKHIHMSRPIVSLPVITDAHQQSQHKRSRPPGSSRISGLRRALSSAINLLSGGLQAPLCNLFHNHSEELYWSIGMKNQLFKLLNEVRIFFYFLIWYSILSFKKKSKKWWTLADWLLSQFPSNISPGYTWFWTVHLTWQSESFISVFNL